MKIKAIREQVALKVLISYLGTSKLIRFWAACQLGEGDYLKLKDQTFEKENVASLYNQIKPYQDSNQ
jgi:hypothetical protein